MLEKLLETFFKCRHREQSHNGGKYSISHMLFAVNVYTQKRAHKRVHTHAHTYTYKDSASVTFKTNSKSFGRLTFAEVLYGIKASANLSLIIPPIFGLQRDSGMLAINQTVTC